MPSPLPIAPPAPSAPTPPPAAKAQSLAAPPAVVGAQAPPAPAPPDAAAAGADADVVAATRAQIQRDRKNAQRDAALRDTQAKLAAITAERDEARRQLEQHSGLVSRARTDPRVLAELGLDPSIALSYGLGDQPAPDPLAEVRELATKAQEEARLAREALADEQRKRAEYEQREQLTKKQLTVRAYVKDEHPALQRHIAEHGPAALQEIIEQVEYEDREFGSVDLPDVIRRMEAYRAEELAKEVENVLRIPWFRKRLGLEPGAPDDPKPKAEPLASPPAGLAGLRADAAAVGKPLSPEQQTRRAFDEYYARLRAARQA